MPLDLGEAMERRHAVREYTDEPVGADAMDVLRAQAAACNAQSGLGIQLVEDDADAFGGCPTHYGRFRGVRHAIALVGPDDPARPASLDEQVGYYGERLALTATALGLATSWAVLHETTEHQGRWTIGAGERMPAAIAFGHGAREGRPHRSKPEDELGAVEHGSYAQAPAWFRAGVRAAMLAPSALGKQPFRLVLLADGRTVRAEALDGLQPWIGLGIARLHFELGAGGADFAWDRPLG